MRLGKRLASRHVRKVKAANMSHVNTSHGFYIQPLAPLLK